VDDPLHRVIEDGELVHPGENHPSKIVTWAIDDFEKMGRAVFLKRLTRALANKETPTVEERKWAWNSCAFTNYVTGTVGEGARERPSRTKLIDAQNPFLELLETLGPRRIVVFGKGMWPNMPECEVYITDDFQAYKDKRWGACLGNVRITPSRKRKRKLENNREDDQSFQIAQLA
jgi:hypothetical protein